MSYNLKELERRKKNASRREEKKGSHSGTPTIESFVRDRNWQGVMTLCDFLKQSKQAGPDNLAWKAYAAFHLGNYTEAYNIYGKILANDNASPAFYLYAAICLFYLGHHKEAQQVASEAPKGAMFHRLMMHIGHKVDDEDMLVDHYRKLGSGVQDQLSLAALNFVRGSYQEATQIYKKVVIEHRGYLAAQVFLAMCYHKLDYYDVSQKILKSYLAKHRHSILANNLRACNLYKTANGKAAEDAIMHLVDRLKATSSTFTSNSVQEFGSGAQYLHWVVKHNLVVFRSGENAVAVLPPLLDKVPEARLNLCIYYLNSGEIDQACALMKDVEPVTPSQFILKAVTNAAIGQRDEDEKALKTASKCFELVGASPSEKDTIHGRMCMGSKLVLSGNFTEALLYLTSIKDYVKDSVEFWYNFGIAQAAEGAYPAAEESFENIRSTSVSQDYVFVSWFCRTLICNGKPRQAWELYLNMENSRDSGALLMIIATDCYRTGAFYYAVKAFDVLEKISGSNDYFEGKRGACAGLFQQVIAEEESPERLIEVVNMLEASPQSPDLSFMIQVMSSWIDQSGIQIMN